MKNTCRKQFTLSALFCAVCFAPAWAAWRPLPPIANVTKLNNGVELAAGKARIRVTALTDTTIRVRIAPEGNFSTQESWAVVPEAGNWSAAARVTDKPGHIEISTASLRVRVEKSSPAITFLTSAGEVIAQDAATKPMSYDGAAFRIWKSMPEDEHYFGLGDKAGPLDHRNQAFTNWNTDAFGWQESTDPLYKTIPFFLALKNGKSYGIFLDNTWRSNFDFGKESRDTYSFGSDGGELDYYFFYGPHPKQVVENFTALVGRTPLPPLWSLGFQQCRYSYYPEARVREIARNFRQRKIPADVIYLDIDYQDHYRPFTINREYFPHFEEMIRDLGKDGFKIIAITDLHIAKFPGYKPYDEGLAGDHFVKNPDGSVYVGKVWPGDSVFPEFTRAASRQWWGTLYKDFVGMGIKGFWNDMNEPAIFERADKTMPLDTVHRLDGQPSQSHRAIHNVFGMENARATYEGLRRLQGDERPFVLTRAAYAGAQRYAASWTGDNSSTWNHLRMSIPNLLNLGISGYPLVGDDIGGFNGSPTAELLTRWLELGAFNPIYRDHTMKGSADQEPWVHGPEHEAIRRRYIDLRYQLLPYLYTGMEETSRTGIPLMRPLFLEYPETASLAGNDSEFLFGRDLLVAPKVWDMIDPYEVELPPGDWYDYWTGERKSGGQKFKVNPPLDGLPLYARAGAIIPEQPVVQSTAEAPNGPLALKVYPGPDCAGSLYLDDGATFAYTRGEFLRINFTCAATADSVTVKMATATAKYSPWWKTINVEVQGAERQPQSVLINGQRSSDWKYAVEKHQVSVELPAAATAEIKVSY